MTPPRTPLRLKVSQQWPPSLIEKTGLKDEEKKTFQSIMKRVNTKVEEEEGHALACEKSGVVVNARNVRFLDKVMSKKCKKCNSIKPPKSHHCSTCRHCVARMDHHCPWVNNCVGYYTQKHFILFLIYVFNGSGHALFHLFRKGLYCLDGNCQVFQSVGNLVLSKITLLNYLAIVAIFLALLFCLFVSIMFFDQISCIINETSSKPPS